MTGEGLDGHTDQEAEHGKTAVEAFGTLELRVADLLGSSVQEPGVIGALGEGCPRARSASRLAQNTPTTSVQTVFHHDRRHRRVSDDLVAPGLSIRRPNCPEHFSSAVTEANPCFKTPMLLVLGGGGAVATFPTAAEPSRKKC